MSGQGPVCHGCDCPLQAQSVRLPLESGTQRLRGFGYAEFDNINDLKEALSLKGEVSHVP